MNDLQVAMSKNEKIARWLGWRKEDNAWFNPDGQIVLIPRWDKEIDGWRSQLFEVIETTGIWYDFITALVANMDSRRVIAHEEDGSDWVELGTVLIALRSSPAQLTDALISAIGKNTDKDLVAREAVNLVWGGELAMI